MTTKQEWDLLRSIQEGMQNIQTRVAVIEQEIFRWRSREKILIKLWVGITTGIVVWYVSRWFGHT
jgi:hypothetical protein